MPAEKFESFVESVEKESIFTNYERVKPQDVSEEYVDVTTRLATKKEVRDRYVEILRSKAKTVKEVLDAEEKIRVIQEEIEAAEGRLKYLNNRTTMSTITLNIYEELEANATTVYKKSYFSKLKESFSTAWDTVENLSLGLVAIWPLLILGGLGIFLWRRFRKKPELPKAG